MKKLFSIVLYEPNAEIENRILNAYAEHHKYTDTFYLICTGPSVLTNDVAETIGLKGENRLEDSSGVVFKINPAFSGYTQKSLWEWLESAISRT